MNDQSQIGTGAAETKTPPHPVKAERPFLQIRAVPGLPLLVQESLRVHGLRQEGGAEEEGEAMNPNPRKTDEPKKGEAKP